MCDVHVNAHSAPPRSCPHESREETHGGCGCGHEEGAAEGGRLDIALLALGFAALTAGLAGGDILSEANRRILYGAAYLICGYPVLLELWSSLRKGRFFDEFTLMGGATLAAIALGEWAEALGVMIFYRLGEMLQEHAAGRSRRSIKNLLAMKPAVAYVMDGDSLIPMPPEEVTAGMKILVKPGEKIPVDGRVTAGESRVDTSPITGEPVPARASQEAGTKVFGGTINLEGSLTIEASGPFADSSIARVMEMVENAAARKSPTERFITRFAAVYTPAMFAVALLTATVPPVFMGAPWHQWLYRALVILMISCPCALVMSIPLAYFGGIGAASKRGILIKGSGVLDAANEISAVAFDKTGTLTRGVFEVTGVRPAPGVEADELEHAAAAAESLSNHPVARSIRNWAKPGLPRPDEAFPGNCREIAGKGVIAIYNGVEYAAGNLALAEEMGVSAGITPAETEGTAVYVTKGGRYMGVITVSDVLKDDAPKAVARLGKKGIKSYMLTGDREEGAAWVAQKLGLDGYRSGLLPEMKVTALDELSDAAKTAFVGDGINDAPILALARVGVAMGELGSEIAIEAADAVVLNDAPSRVADLVEIAGYTRNVTRQNIVMALGVKAAFMVLGIIGMAGLWEAMFADVGVALLAILNAARISRA